MKIFMRDSLKKTKIIAVLPLLAFLSHGESCVATSKQKKVNTIEELIKPERRCNVDEDCVCGITEDGRKIFGNKNYVVKPASNCVEEKEMGFCDRDFDICVIQRRYCCTKNAKENESCEKNSSFDFCAVCDYYEGFQESKRPLPTTLNKITYDAGRKEKDGDYVGAIKGIEEVIKNYDKCYEIDNKHSSKNFLNFLFFYTKLAELYLEIGEIEKAKGALDKAYDMLDKLPENFPYKNSKTRIKNKLDELKNNIKRNF